MQQCHLKTMSGSKCGISKNATRLLQPLQPSFFSVCQPCVQTCLNCTIKASALVAGKIIHKNSNLPQSIRTDQNQKPPLHKSKSAISRIPGRHKTAISLASEIDTHLSKTSRTRGFRNFRLKHEKLHLFVRLWVCWVFLEPVRLWQRDNFLDNRVHLLTEASEALSPSCPKCKLRL